MELDNFRLTIFLIASGNLFVHFFAVIYPFTFLKHPILFPLITWILRTSWIAI